MKIDLSFNDENFEKALKKPIIMMLREILKDQIFGSIPKDSYLSIAIVDNAEIRKLNKNYRNIDKPTDVLSFPFNESLPKNYILGEIIISMEEALKRSKVSGITEKEELLKLLIHGLLHLVNYDHKTPEDEEEMTLHENRLFTKFRERRKSLYI